MFLVDCIQPDTIPLFISQIRDTVTLKQNDVGHFAVSNGKISRAGKLIGNATFGSTFQEW